MTPYFLPAPRIVAGVNGFIVTLVGGFESDSHPGGQYEFVQLWDDDLAFDDLLYSEEIYLEHDDNTWDGLLLGYQIDVSIELDETGYILEPVHTTDEIGANLYQRQVSTGSMSAVVDLLP